MITLIDGRPPTKAAPGSLFLFQQGGIPKFRDEKGNDTPANYEHPVPAQNTPVAYIAASFANGELQATTIEADDTVTIGEITYTFVDTLTDPDVAYEVLVGADTEESLANLAAAINADPGAGTIYGNGTEAHTDVTATAYTAYVTLIAVLAGEAGNSIATEETLTDGNFIAATMGNGADQVDGTVATAGTILFDNDFIYIALTDTTVEDSSGWAKITRTPL